MLFDKKYPHWLQLLGGASILLGLSLRLIQYAGTITNNPLSLDWSESFRIYSASLIYSMKVYGQQLNWPWLDPGRAVLEGLVLLLPGTQIWMFRIWQAILFFISSTLSSILIIRRVYLRSGVLKKNRILLLILVGWGILYFLQGPVYFHVLLGILPVVWLFDSKKPFRTLFIIIIASGWEAICRVNWFFMPAVTAVLLYLLEVPIRERVVIKYLKWPFIWMIAGIFVSSLTYWLFLKGIQYPVFFLNPEMRYPFLASKLWPNTGFNLGLIPGILIMSSPLLLLVTLMLVKGGSRDNWLRKGLLGGISAAYFLGSTYVSLRAGGGYDLHNYDTFLLLLSISFVYMAFDLTVYDRSGEKSRIPSLVYTSIFILLLVIPVYFAARDIDTQPGSRKISPAQVHVMLEQLRDIIEETDTSKGPILFIHHRQFMVYGLVPPVALFEPYGHMELMEMSMANNQEYLDQFYTDIRDQRFSLIISEILLVSIQDPLLPWGYESNSWSEDVSYPVLEFYTPIYTDGEASIGVYVPVEK